MNPAVSIVIPCFNAERWISRAIESCLRQTVKPVDVIVVDDGSTDRSFEIVKELASKFPGIVQFHAQHTQGAPVARNAGAALTRGELLLFLDADDYLAPDGLQSLVDAIGTDGDIAFGGVSLVDDHDATIGSRSQAPPSEDRIIARLEGSAITSSILFRRSVIDKCPWNPEMPCAQEFALQVDCAVQGFHFCHTPRIVANIRQHDSTTRISNRMKSALPASVARVFLKCERDLQARNEYSEPRRIVVHAALLNLAIWLWRNDDREFARNLYARVDRRAARQWSAFRLTSYLGIAMIAGLKASHAVWLMREGIRAVTKPSWLSSGARTKAF